VRNEAFVRPVQVAELHTLAPDHVGKPLEQCPGYEVGGRVLTGVIEKPDDYPQV
jgi:hypothetical protein